MAVEKLMRLKKSIEDAKINQAKLQGRLDALYEELKSKYGLSNTEEALAELEANKAKLAELQTHLDEGMIELKERYDW